MAKSKLLEEAYDLYRSYIQFEEHASEALKSLKTLPIIRQVTFVGEKRMDGAILEMQNGDEKPTMVGVVYGSKDGKPDWQVSVGRLSEVHQEFVNFFMDSLAATIHAEEIMDLRKWNSLPD